MGCEGDLSVGARTSNEAETRFLRDVNDRVHSVLLKLGTDGSPGQYLCECGRAGCLATIELDVPEYEAIRSSGKIVALPGHGH
jgi:hypothetical protein